MNEGLQAAQDALLNTDKLFHAVYDGEHPWGLTLYNRATYTRLFACCGGFPLEIALFGIRTAAISM